MRNKIYFYYAIIFFVLSVPYLTQAQTTEFTYQGKLNNSGTAANTNHDFEFRLFDAASAGTALATLERLNVAVTNGIFTVQLDFGAQFTGANRFLEIAVRPAGSGGYQQLLPRQPITSAPYAIRSLNASTAGNAASADSMSAACILCVTDGHIASIDSSKITGVLSASKGGTGIGPNPPPANVYLRSTGFGWGLSGLSASDLSGVVQVTNGGTGSSTKNFVDLSTNQTIAGGKSFTGAVGVTGGSGVFNGNASGLTNLNAVATGQVVKSVNTLKDDVTLAAGANITITPVGNTLTIASTGGNAILNQTTQQSGANFNISGTGSANIFNATLGFYMGSNRVLSVGGTGNIFAGVSAGTANTTGNYNSFVGSDAGASNTMGNQNSFVGATAGFSNTGGYNNTFFGTGAGNGNTTGYHNVFIGHTAGPSNTTGSNNIAIGYLANVGGGVGGNLTYATVIGSGAAVFTSNTIVLGRGNGADNVVIYGLGVGGNTALCRNSPENQISTCSSSLRYKTNIAPFRFGLDLISQLKPISFDWKKGGMKDVGFGAEDVARINPLFVNYNAAGEVEGVKYDRLSTVFVNAFEEQQTQISLQQAQNERQQREIDELKQIVCTIKPDAAACKATGPRP